VEEDFETGDVILVNSDFVKKTLTDYGVQAERIVVMYWGVDVEMEEFLRLEKTRRRAKNEPLRFLFAGGVGKRKGADKVLEVFERLGLTGWDLTLAGGVEPELKKKVHKTSNPRIHVLGPVLRSKLAELMLENDVLVFPSLAEGSARVVFEAMGAGMAIITTPNAGSVVEHGKHGLVVPAGDTARLKEAVEFMMQHRDLVTEYGMKSRDLIRRDYSSTKYREGIVSLYRQVSRGSHTSALGIRMPTQ
jgi:glycosyltransferase involved in cell wall biosynthesis